MDYASFLAAQSRIDPPTGLASPPAISDALFPFQADIVRWALRRGRAGVFAGTGLGKTLMELAWADAIHRATSGDVLVFAPLAVAAQIIREAAKFGIPARHVRHQGECGPGINVTNYQKLDHFEIGRFIGVILDESSILKNLVGHYRTKLIRACAQVPFRLAATATPAPNDFMELGNHAEFLGVMSYTDMLATFFVHDGGATRDWRLKGHAEDEFWRWLASFSVMLRKPSDLGYPDDGYALPPLLQHQHVVSADHDPIATGTLFPMEARTMRERLDVRRGSVAERVSLAARLTPMDRPFAWWCHLNAESDALAAAIPGSVEIRGSDSEEDKERKVLDFAEGRILHLISKPSICGFGLNFQHCADTGFVGLNDSWEQVYQAVRRFWRFGQTKPVNAHFIATDREGPVVANLRRKEADADRMAEAMVRHMADLGSAAIRGASRDRPTYAPGQRFTLPSWIGAAS